MKHLKLLLSVLIAACLFLSGCNDNESKPDILIVVDPADGMVYRINPSNGALTEIDQITLNSAALTNLRGLVYHKSAKKLFATSTNSGSGKLFSIDPVTLNATLINGNTNNEWYGIPDIKVTSDNKLICSTWHKAAGAGDGPGLLIFETNGTVNDAILFTTDDPNGVDVCCGFGMAFGSKSSELIFASSENGLDIYTSTLAGKIALKSSLSLEGFDETMNEFDYTIRNIVKRGSTYYAIVYNWSDSSTVFAKIDLSNNKLIQIMVLSEDESQTFQGLAVIPAGVL